MHKFVRGLITEWRQLQLPFEGESVIVAVSGGADSTALLLALSDLKERKKLQHKFIAAHFNHMLRGIESDGDERFVIGLARGLGFEFSSGKGALKGSSNLEERARNERYKFLAKVADENDSKLVLTAHTMNDQAETILMNLVRGTGTNGLVGIQKIRPLEIGSAIQLVRPLLGWAKRADTESFCGECGVDFRLDTMNEDPRFTRVRIRKSVIPLLADINPNIIETLARTAELVQPDNKGKIVNASESIRLADLTDLSKTELYLQLRVWLREHRGSTRGLQLKHIEAVARLVNSPKSGRVVELPGGDTVIRHGGRLAFRHIKLEN